MASSLNRELFEANSAAFIEKAIKEYVAASPGNCFQAFDGDPIFDEPLIGFADGDDAIFQDYKAIIGDFHLTPGRLWRNTLSPMGAGNDTHQS